MHDPVREPPCCNLLTDYSTGEFRDRSWKQEVGTLVGDATDSTGKLDLDGSGDYLDLTASADYSPGESGVDTPFTIVGNWTNDNSGGWGILCSKRNVTTGVQDWLIDAQSAAGARIQTSFYMPTSAGNRIVNQSSPIVWSAGMEQIAVTYDGSGSHTGIENYRNAAVLSGAKSMTGTYTGGTNTAAVLRIGGWFYPAVPRAFNGKEHGMLCIEKREWPLIELQVWHQTSINQL